MSHSQINHTNETSGMTDGDRLKLEEFLKQLVFWWKITLTFIAILIVLGNIWVLIVTWKERTLHQPNKYFIACLAVADLLVGIFLIPPSVLIKKNSDHTSPQSTRISVHLCRFIVWIDAVALATSIYTLTFISLDRYLKISKPLQYKSRMTTSRSLKVILVIVLVAISLATYSATPNSGSYGVVDTVYGTCNFKHDPNKVKTYYVFLAFSAFFIPALIILTLYALIFRVAHKRNKMLSNGGLGQTFSDQNQRSALRQDMKVIRMLLVVVGVFICCWGPWFSWILVWFYSRNIIEWENDSYKNVHRMNIIHLTLRTLPLFNSLCNPFIYACLDQTYREASKHLFRRMTCQPDTRGRQSTIDLHTSRI
ncbi:trace amine-associated receptor 5-like [Dendronephthya gigantea]|uniref:trace amine-associated receptor 5-like n=1 Tax=Dendronephthya gigantea TaxID=151771 RepID=UPI0010692E1D|nr:trace amine-associated receptor 5-like [Dendronephthya gigantea]